MKVSLRVAEKRDAEMMREWRNDPDVRKWFFHSRPVSRREHAAWFESTTDAIYIVVADGEDVGYVRLSSPDADGDRHLSIAIGKRGARGKGVATRALGLAVRSNPGTIVAEVLPNNDAAIGLYRKLGFKPTKIVMERTS